MNARERLVVALQIIAATGMILLYSNYLPAQENWGSVYDSKTKERIGEVRKRSDRHYEIYGLKGDRKATGVQKGDVIEFFNNRGDRLDFEIRVPKDKNR